MTGLVDWAASRARMIVAFIALSIGVGVFAYIGLPKEGEPDIEIPAIVISLPFPGISAADAESLLIKPMETELADLDGLKRMSSTAAEGYANVVLEFEYGWDKSQVLADVRDAMTTAEAEFPEGYEQYTMEEFNFSEFPIIIVSLSGSAPERTVARVAKDLQDKLESLDAVLEAAISGNRDEMLEVLIDPLRLEAYNVTASELINVVRNNNQLVAAGEVRSEQGSFSVKIPSSFDDTLDVYGLPVKTNGDRVVTLGDLATINLTFEDREGTARFNGSDTIALQVVKRKGFNLIDTATLVRETVEAESEAWPDGLRVAVNVTTSNDQSRTVDSMIKQLQGSVITAIILVMLVSLAALGLRASLLVGFAIPTSFLLCFALLALMGISISNIVMFGLILSVGMLVDGAIVVVEYADKRQAEGAGPMQAYVDAAKRMFWPVISSTATTLCAFLPMLFWPGTAGEFMGMLPVTLIFVLSASLVVALVYLPVMGGVVGWVERWVSEKMSRIVTMGWLGHIALVLAATCLAAVSSFGMGIAVDLIAVQFGGLDTREIWNSVVPVFVAVFGIGVVALLLAGVALVSGIIAVIGAMALLERIIRLIVRFVMRIMNRLFGLRDSGIKAGYRRSLFGRFIELIVGTAIMPLVVLGCVFVFVGGTLFYYINNNAGVEFFVDTETEQAIVYVLARGNLSLAEKDAAVREVEAITLNHPGIATAFAFAGTTGLNANTGGAAAPRDTIGQIQLETVPWEERPTVREEWFRFFGRSIEREVKDPLFDGDGVLDELTEALSAIPGVSVEVIALSDGPASGKPVQLRLKGQDFDTLTAAAALARTEFEQMPGLTLVEDTRPLPGIDWQIDVDVEKAGRYGADVATVGAMVQLVTRGLLLDTYTPLGSDEEIEIRVRLPEQDRVLSTLDTLRVRTPDGLIPLSNFITRQPVPKLAQIDRVDQQRYYDIKADVLADLYSLKSDGETIAVMRPDPNGSFTNPAGGTFAILSSEEPDLRSVVDSGTVAWVPVTATERREEIARWLESEPFPAGVEWEWTGDQEDQEESAQFLQSAFSGALFLMFIILLAQFNSFYNALLVLLAVVLSTSGVLWGMLIMDQTFSIIMTGTGIVALAGIVVNNNIVLIDTYQEYERYMPRIEAIIRTAQARIRPVLLTTITTMAGLAPMMFGLSIDFANSGYTVDSPTALWWKQLATAVVFGLGVATMLTLVVTPSLLAMRVWVVTYAEWLSTLLAKMSLGRASQAARDWALARAAHQLKAPEITWARVDSKPQRPLRAAE